MGSHPVSGLKGFKKENSKKAFLKCLAPNADFTYILRNTPKINSKVGVNLFL
jgi:hypothetical protein